MTRILLVTPTFHGYWRSISDALERKGHRVDTHRYDGVDGRFGSLGRKMHTKLRNELPERIGRDTGDRVVREVTEHALTALHQSSPEVVVVVKGDLIGEAFWDALDGRKLPRVLWLYDELRRMRHVTENLRRAGPVASYSMLDVAHLKEQSVHASYLPMAFDPTIATPDPRNRNDELVFVGARYPRRVAQLQALHDAGVPVRVYGRDWSHHPMDRARTWGAPRPDLPWGRDLSRANTYLEMAAAAGALNIHGDQDGFTMRTFEACGVGGLQLIDRPDVGDLYEPDRELLVFRDTAELVELAGKVRADTRWTDAIRERGRARTLAQHTFDHRVSVLESLWLESPWA